MANEQRLNNLRKLFLVPVFALRDLLLEKMQTSDERQSEVRRMPQIELVQETDRNLKVTEADVDNLHEAYRYGRRLSFQLYLLPSQMSFTVLPEDIQAAITSVLEEQKKAEDIKHQKTGGDNDLQEIRDLTICDYEVFGNIVELRYRYQVAIHYLDDNEEPAYVYDTQYGFVWVNTNDNFLVFLSRDIKINKSLLTGISRALKAQPRQVTLPKELINEHFPLEHIRSVSHFDPKTGVRQSISGEAEGLEPFMPQIQNRESSYSRESARYDEEIVEGIKSGLGVNPRQGKIYLMKTLSASTVRAWAQRILPALIQDLRLWAAQDSTRSTTTSAAVNHMRVSNEGRSFVSSIIDAIAQAKKEGQSDIRLSVPPLVAYPSLGGKYLTISIQNTCEECEESANLCTNCQSPELAVNDKVLQCAVCGTSLSRNDEVTLKCPNGHTASVEINQVLYLMPLLGLEQVVSRALINIGVEWKSGIERFWIMGDTLCLAKIPHADSTIVHGDAYTVQISGDAKNIAVGRDITFEEKYDEPKE